MSTAYHSQYFAYELTKQNASNTVGRLSQSLINATVDLNPHQVEAALFAFRAPLERGAILADEVGLGKTIEAGLIISQLWAERKRKILIIVPPPLRKQWNRELIEKFYIPSLIIESKNYNEYARSGQAFPFEQKDYVVITSYQFARNKSADLKRTQWDLIIIDEAHRLRNVYKKTNKISRILREATDGSPKVLLTATPLQNSLMELYGLVSFIDPRLFGDESTFRKQFGSGTKEMTKYDFLDLKDRLKPVCHRTLRRQVTEYVPYTKRIPLVQEFTSSTMEWELYEKVSSYLQREDILALPKSQRNLMTLVVRKILASSSFAISDTLLSLVRRLEASLEEEGNGQGIEIIYNDIDELDTTVEEWSDEEEQSEEDGNSKQERALLLREREELLGYYELATSITENEKGNALLVALTNGFAKLRELGANDKAVIFTESRRTQMYLKEMLEQNGYAGKIVMFNGTNSSPEIKEIYQDWLEQHQHDDQITGSKTSDTRAALVEYFRNEAAIMIATESAAEGINFQFCSLVVNYDLPWNPQRIEQRIGRCHRYGQKYDVVVINFLNRKNAADKRVFELLSQKFSLFDGVFGSSDEVLGSLESGVDFEKRIQQIYQTCRTAEEIQDAFNQLQLELDEQIQCKMQETRKNLLENFDDEVREKLRNHHEQTTLQLNKMERYLWALSVYEGSSQAKFNSEQLSFQILNSKDTYQLISHAKKNASNEHVHHFRLGHPLAENWIEQAKNRHLPMKKLTFRYSDYEGKVSLLQSRIGSTGYLSLNLLQVSAAENEEHLIFSAVDSNGNQLDQELCEKLLDLPANEAEMNDHEQIIHSGVSEQIAAINQQQESAILWDIQERTNEFLDRELERLDKWSKDLKDKLEVELRELDVEITQLQKEARLVRQIAEKLEINKTIREHERQRSELRRNLFDAQDEIDRQKEILFLDVEKKLEQKVSKKHLFLIKWQLV